MNIRPATDDDLDAVFTLISEFSATVVSRDAVSAALWAINSTPDGDVLLLHDDTGHLVALAVVSLAHKLLRREVHVDEVVVSSDARGHGYSLQLMQAVEAWARDHDTDLIELTSRPSRIAANHLYQKLGYQIHETNVYQKKRGEF